MPATTAYRGRFAPSPTGPLHFGSLLAAFGSWLMARQAGGTWLVRIDDLDPPREVGGAADEQLRTLAAFGMTADEPVVYQSHRHALYAAALERLQASGQVFTCHCSRSDLAATRGIHRQCVAGAQRSDPALRLRIEDGTCIAFDDLVRGTLRQDAGRVNGDPVLRRSDGLWAYVLAVVVDDADQGITHVVRGGDLLDTTPLQIHVQRQLGLPTPAYAHLPLILDEDGRKLSKSAAALPVNPDNPLPALRAAWAALGQDAAAVAGPSSVEGLLQHAVSGFDSNRITNTGDLPLAALHNGNVTVAD